MSDRTSVIAGANTTANGKRNATCGKTGAEGATKTAQYTCIACAEPIQHGQAIIVGVDVGGYPDTLPVNIVAHRGCEDRGRAVVAKEIAERERGEKCHS